MKVYPHSKPPIYLFSHKISYKNFYSIWKLFPPEGITPNAMIKGKFIWEMIRDKQLYVFLDKEGKDDNVFFSLKLPKRDILLLENKK